MFYNADFPLQIRHWPTESLPLGLLFESSWMGPIEQKKTKFERDD
jgi:hypothetical protein